MKKTNIFDPIKEKPLEWEKILSQKTNDRMGKYISNIYDRGHVNILY